MTRTLPRSPLLVLLMLAATIAVLACAAPSALAGEDDEAPPPCSTVTGDDDCIVVPTPTPTPTPAPVETPAPAQPAQPEVTAPRVRTPAKPKTRIVYRTRTVTVPAQQPVVARPVQQGAGTVPVGAVSAGGGGTASDSAGLPLGAAIAGVAAALLLALAGAVTLRTPRRGTR